MGTEAGGQLVGTEAFARPNAEVMTAPSAGQRFSRYEILRKLGEGGMGAVHEARHIELGSRVALKLIHTVDVQSTSFPKRVLREARAAAQLEHEHVVRVFDVGTERGISFIVMELLEGEDIAKLLARRRWLSVPEIAEIFLPVVSAVEAAHARGILHRDLKPANIVLARTAAGLLRPVVTDFGICKMSGDGEYENLTQSAAMLGSIPYLSPEQTRGAKYTGIPTDQYAIGVMLYECATGKRPFQGASSYELMHAIVNAKVADPCELQPALPRAFGDLILRAMARDPDCRFPQLRQLGSALLAFAEEPIRSIWAPSLSAQDAQTSPDLQADSSSDSGTRRSRLSRTDGGGPSSWVTGRRSELQLTAVAAALLLGAAAGHLLTRSGPSRLPRPVLATPSASRNVPDALPASSGPTAAVLPSSGALSADAPAWSAGTLPSVTAPPPGRRSRTGRGPMRPGQPNPVQPPEPEMGSNHTIILD